MVALPFRLNLCPIGAPAVPGYINFAPAAYSAGVGYGYADAIDSFDAKRTNNIFTFPYDFDNAVWSKDTVTVVPNVAIAPDGTLTADKLTTNAVANKSIFQVGPSGGSIANRTYTFSAWVKNEEVDRTIRLEIQANPPGSIFVQDFVVLREDGWRRIQITATFPPGEVATSMRALIRPSSNFINTSTLIWGGKAAEVFGGNFQDDERYDTIHRLEGSVTDDLRIDLPVGFEYDVNVAVGDPSLGLSNGRIDISDNGFNAITFTQIALSPNVFQHLGHVLVVNNFLRIRTGRVIGGPYDTAIAFIVINAMSKRGATLRAVNSRRNVLRSVTPIGTRRTP